MTLLFMDSFDHYSGNSSVVLKKWDHVLTTQGNDPSTSSGRRGTSGMRFYNVDGYDRARIGKNIGEADTFIVGVAIYPSTLDNGENKDEYNTGFHTAYGTGTFHIYINFISGTNSIRVRRGSATGTMLGETANNALSLSQWQYVEAKIYHHDTAGTVEIRVNGDTVLNLTSQDTKNGTTTPNTIFLSGNSYNNGNVYYDDFYVCNGSGSTNNDFLGDVRVESILPSGVGSSTDWAPSAGNNYECVDESTPNDNTDYVSENTTGDHDTYAFSSIGLTSGSIYGVQQLVYANKADAGSRYIKTVCRSGTTDYPNSNTYSVSDTYTYYEDVLEQDPDTSSAWTISGVNAAEFGMELEA